MLSYVNDIRPLFRPKGISSMIAFSSIDLGSYTDVVGHSDDILVDRT
jgi:hypothetical protein